VPILRPLFLFLEWLDFAIAIMKEIKTPIKNIGMTAGKFPKFEA
jgi:hypothetical protein